MSYKIGDYLKVKIKNGKPTVETTDVSYETLIIIGIKRGDEYSIDEALCYIPPESKLDRFRFIRDSDIKNFGVNKKYLGDAYTLISSGYIAKKIEGTNTSRCTKCCEPLPYVNDSDAICWQCRTYPYRK